MAKALGTSIDTIKNWEAKRRNPTGLVAKVLAIIQANPEFPRHWRHIKFIWLGFLARNQGYQ